MKKHVNLQIKKKGYQKLEKILLTIKTVSFVLVLLVFLLTSVLFLLRTSVRSEYTKLETQKANLLTLILRRKTTENEAIYFNQKSTYFNTNLKEDVNFLPYYRNLQKYLELASNSASIESIDYDNKRNVSMVLKFNDYESFYSYLSSLQDPVFLNLFETLRLDSFSITEAKVSNYNLSFTGKFKEITK